MKFNIPLWHKVRRKLRAEPLRLNMSEWLTIKGKIRGNHNGYIEKEGEGDIFSFGYQYKYPDCNTVGCLAGWTVLTAGKKLTRRTKIPAVAAKLLGIPHGDQDKLFLTDDWPNPFWSEYEELSLAFNDELDLKHQQAIRAQEVALVERRVEHYIKTGE